MDYLELKLSYVILSFMICYIYVPCHLLLAWFVKNGIGNYIVRANNTSTSILLRGSNLTRMTIYCIF